MIIDPLAYFGEINIYWHAIFVTFGIVAAIVLAWILRGAQGIWRWKHNYAIWLVTPLALIFGTLLSRAIYCYFMPEILEKDSSAFWDFSNGGFVLYGAMIGVVLAVLLVKLIFPKKVYISELLDAIAPAGALAICVGRCASYFSGEDRGEIITSEKWQFMPFAVYDSDGYWHLAVFSFEALAAAIAFVASIVIFVLVYIRRGEPTARGSVFITFLLVFASAQTMLESMRIDALFFITLGFVRFGQVLSAIILFACFVYVNVRTIKKFGFKFWLPILWTAVIGAYVLAFFKEFRLTSGTLVPSYITMGLCLIAICLISFVLLCMTLRPKKEKVAVQGAEEIKPAEEIGISVSE